MAKMDRRNTILSMSFIGRGGSNPSPRTKFYLFSRY